MYNQHKYCIIEGVLIFTVIIIVIYIDIYSVSFVYVVGIVNGIMLNLIVISPSLNNGSVNFENVSYTLSQL